MRLPLHTCLLALLIPAASLADEVTLRDGRKLVGKARWTDAGLEVELKQGSIVFKPEEVLKLEVKELPEEELARRRAALAPDDWAGRVELAAFGIEHDLHADASALLLQVVERPAPPPPAEGAEPSAELKARAEAEVLLRKLDFHLVDGKWTSPDEYYPPRGFVKHKGKWILRAEVERQKAARDRRSAESEEREATKAERSASRRADKAQQAAAEAEAELAKAEARIEHYLKEAKRIEELLAPAKAELARRENALRQAEQDAYAQVAVLDAWLLNPCRCRPTCTCGWDSRRRQLVIISDAANRRLTEARLARNEVAARVRSIETDLAEANRLLAKARATHAKAAASAKSKRRAAEKAEDKVDQAADKADEAARKADEAGAREDAAEDALLEGQMPPDEGEEPADDEAPEGEKPAEGEPPAGGEKPAGE